VSCEPHYKVLLQILILFVLANEVTDLTFKCWCYFMYCMFYNKPASQITWNSSRQ